MNDPSPVDARTSPSTVWKLVEHLKGDELVAWRMADLSGRLSAEDRNLTGAIAQLKQALAFRPADPAMLKRFFMNRRLAKHLTTRFFVYNLLLR